MCIFITNIIGTCFCVVFCVKYCKTGNGVRIPVLPEVYKHGLKLYENHNVKLPHTGIATLTIKSFSQIYFVRTM